MSQRASEVIAERLRKMVITEELTSGTIISEAQLSEMLGCTRTPLRQALQQLSHHYLVDIPPRRGVVIPHLSIVDYQQLSEAQLLMGGELVLVAAERIDDRQLERLKDIVADQERSNQQADFYSLAELDGQFHTLIAEATDNRYFTDFTRRMHSALARFLYRAYQAAGGANLSIREHWQIVNALESKDADLAKLELRQHVAQASKRVLNTLGLGGDQSEGL
jgi:DNA-binding GntR family transcriptional regulator